MQEKLKQFAEKAKGFFGKMNKKVRVILGCVIAALLIGAVAIAVVLNNRPYTVLFTGLSSSDMSSIIAYLSENETADYRVEGTDTILVPESQESQLKANLLMQNYPTSGFSYQTYRDGVSAMSTNAEQQMAYMQDLQDRMAGVIRCMDGVKDAVVTIAQGEDRRYVLDSSNVVEASAAVMVTMQDGGALPKQVATAVRNLISNAVQGLEIDNISITDSQGNTYNGDDSLGNASDASQLKLQLEETQSNKVRSQILSVLIPLYGEDNVKVTANVKVDVDHSVDAATLYTLPEWAADGSTGGEGIIGSKIYDQEVIRGDDGDVGGVVGNEDNADISTYVENEVNPDGTETYIGNQGEVNYNTNTATQQRERVAGYVADLMVSVSINSAVSGSVNTTELMGHVARAAGITPEDQTDKISILVAPFYSPNDGIVPVTPGLTLPPWAIYAAIAGAVLLLVVMILIMILSRKRRRRRAARINAMAEAAAARVQEEPELPPPDLGADIMNVKTERSIQLRQEIRKFAEESPELTAQMLKNWLRGDDDA